VIQLDDKENGIILIRGSNTQKMLFMGSVYSYVYYYDMTFKMKENRYKYTLDKVYFESTMFSGRGSIIKIQPFDGKNCPETGTFASPGLPKKIAIEMMNSLRQDLQLLADSYDLYIKQENKAVDNW
jgi:hypothetical protein